MKQRRIWCYPKDSLDQVAAIICVALITQLLISYPLWESSTRSFPLFPLIEGVSVSAIFSVLQFYFILVLLAITALCDFKKYTIPLVVGLIIIWLLQDIMRLQAWLYQYLILLTLVSLVKYYPSKKNVTLGLMRMAIIFVYIWTGWYKCNVHFVDSVYPWLMGIFPLTTPLADEQWLGYMVAVFEALLGLGLFWKKSRSFSRYLVIIFHLIILILLVTDQWNHVVYAWNICMILLVWILFHPKSEQASYIDYKYWPISYPMLFLFVIAPSLYRLGAWPYDLSFTMYSGLSTELEILIDKELLNHPNRCIPIEIIPSMTKKEAPWYAVNTDIWTMQTMNVPTYPAVWYYEGIARNLCNCLEEDQGIFFQISIKEPWSLETKDSVFDCTTLMNNSRIID